MESIKGAASFICFPSIKRDFDGNLLQSAVGADLADAPALRVHFHFDLVRLFPECISDWRDDTLGSNELLVLNKRSTAAGHNISCIRATYASQENNGVAQYTGKYLTYSLQQCFS